MVFASKCATPFYVVHPGLLKTVCCFESANRHFKMRYRAKPMRFNGKKSDFPEKDFKMSY
jgi:hypothetical protein